jgi:hypothetical protein
VALMNESVSNESSPVDPRETARQLPTTPGVYLMKDVLGRVIGQSA